MFKHTLVALTLTLALAACSRHEAPAADANNKPLQLVQEDLLTVSRGPLVRGPVISGSLQPELQADLRAEVTGVVMHVLKDNGDIVKKGDVLVQLDTTSIRDNLLSAEESLRAATLALEQSERALRRNQELYKKKLVATEIVEAAEIKRNQNQAEVASAKARVVQSQQQLDKTDVRAPFDGIVSDRVVSAGDTVQVGKALLKVVVPSSIRFEGYVAAEQIGRIKVGDPAIFHVNGYADQNFEGKVLRVNPIADPATRQVQVLVSVPPGTKLVSGLYGEGRVLVDSTEMVMLPGSSLVQDGDKHYVWRVQGDKLSRVNVQLGERNERDGRYSITAGLEGGESVLRYPEGALKDGAKVHISTTSGEAAVASTGAAH